jgi:uncharacterized protein YkwD
VKRFAVRNKQLIITVQSILIGAFASGCFSTNAPGEQLGDAEGSAATRCITPEESARMADQVLQLLNLERAERNLTPVSMNEKLTAIAEKYACQMITEKFFEHTDPVTGDGPSARAIEGKYAFYTVGENLAAGPETAADVMKAWMESDSHREVILGPTWQHVGIAIRSGGEYSTYWVQEFGDPAAY